MEDDYIFDDLWNIFSRPKYLYFELRTLNGSDLMAASKQLNIDFTSIQQQILYQTKFKHQEWMDLIQHESINQCK